MKLSRYTYILLLTVFTTINLSAQFVDYGTDPARFKWKYVRTPHYQVIYPQGNDSLAHRYTTFLENVYPHLGKTIGTPKKALFPVVLHPGNMQSNGMVAWAPRRMELVTTPSSDLYAQSWDRQLVIHESRHVFQTGRLFQGIFKPLYYVAGEQIGGVVDLGVPKWFFEGDAVVTETAMSNSGRGRLPEFNMAYRAQMASGNFFSFDKWAMGSYKDYTGNYYALGYDMTAFARHQYGADVWNKVTDRYAKRIYAVPPFSNALKHYTGVRTGGLFHQTFEFLKQEWDQLNALNGEQTPVQYWSPRNSSYTSYRYPQPLNEGEVIAVKSGLKDIHSLVLLRDGQESHLCYIGSLNSRINLAQNRIYWSEYVAGLRWTHQNSSVVKYYDLETGKVYTLTTRQRYLAPAAAPDGKRLAVSRFSPEGYNEVLLLHATTGKELQAWPTPENMFIKEMAFGEDNRLFALGVSDKGIHILQLTLHTGEWQPLTAPLSSNITSPFWADDRLYFESGLNGTNNIYYLDLKDLQVYRLTASRFGSFTPALSADGSRLFISDYQANGYRVGSVEADQLIYEPVDLHTPYRFTLAEEMAAQEQFNLDEATLEPVAFEPKPYRKGANLFRIHSWAPFYYDAMDAVNIQADDFSTIVKPGAMLLSQNALNTAITQAGWYYRKGYHHGKVAFTYMGWYPVIDLTVDYGDEAFNIGWVEDEDGHMTTAGYYPGRNLVEAEAKVYIPFNLTRNHYVRGFQPAVSWYYTNNRYQQVKSGNYRDFQYLLSELRYYHYRRMATQDLLPRWGYQIRLQYLNMPLNTENYGSLYAARLTTYWPGIRKNDGLMLRGGYQYQSVDNKALYIPKRLLEETRGYAYTYRTRQQIAFKADYSFTLFNPDFSIGSLAYIKRVRSNLFYDLTRNQANETSGWNTLSSYGADLIVDWNALRLNYPISLGVRVINPINYGNLQAEALFSISF